MLKTIIAGAIAGTLVVAGPAFADRDRHQEHPSGAVSISSEAMTKKINELGYDVRRLKSDEGRYEAHIVERKSGGSVKAWFDGKDGELIRARLHR